MIIGFTWKRKLPTVGELRNPVSLVRGASVPDGGIGMDLQVSKVYDAWAKVENVSGSYREGSSSKDQKSVTHSVIIRRHPEMEVPEERDFLVYNRRFLRILEIRELDQRAFYWVIACNDEGAIENWSYDDTSTPENPNDLQNPQQEPQAEADFPFWGGS